MSTQNKDKSEKGQPAAAPNKAMSTVDPRTGRSPVKQGEGDEKRKGDLKPTATSKEQDTAGTKSERGSHTERPTHTIIKKS
jgi:hypothetical protein